MAAGFGIRTRGHRAAQESARVSSSQYTPGAVPCQCDGAAGRRVLQSLWSPPAGLGAASSFPLGGMLSSWHPPCSGWPGSGFLAAT